MSQEMYIENIHTKFNSGKICSTMELESYKEFLQESSECLVLLKSVFGECSYKFCLDEIEKVKAVLTYRKQIQINLGKQLSQV